ncbi:MAG: GIY-YIG nuclease family protein, partial [Rikenellaceae bacterium]
MNEFSQLTKESIAYYVYALIDPRDNKIFYIGKGHDDRVFCHINDALNPQNIAVNNDKYEIIRDITRNNNNVKHYILRHNMNETEAFIVESVLINLLTFKDFKHIANISNIICGYRQEEHGIKTAEEVELYYNCQDLVDIQHNILSININEKYNSENVTVYEATRKSWVLDQKRANNV